ncbi:MULTISPECIES: peptidase T [Clostridium]|jgi:tripeptide aminopeptidase|uniref:Peptidase T n=4 Tax=Clostridium TaxID=1485 RepID=A0A1S8R509_CLOBE|nr:MULTISPECIES: peptidase T [Clostridium]ABR34586.1 peptidase T [Clostridium beijerinckii NCIMB 8052]AIU00614.1 peptidase T [Clostridium beijerinckii ATCC 35702]ALB46362.1 peptidase T [Clostridium beijerinckii NRRL B-598]AVK46572.1 peptidase T [Clostridium sp. MF28]MBC2459831.1 peptidase T [Clostridium beijerinckii]
MKAYERLLKYVKVYTTSDESSETHPTTKRQFDLANILVEEMKEIGLQDCKVDEHCYVYGVIPATKGYENKASIGLIAHMDTAPAANGKNVKPQIIENYDGGDIILKGNNSILSPKKFPHLKNLKGKTIITTDGTSLLGADDKAGIAEILTACETIINENIPHGKICVGFTPDEEVGLGAHLFDVKNFGADFAYTIDGGEEGEISYENFNAAAAEVNIHGVSVHPGSAKNTMINATNVAIEFNSMLPSCERPEHTEGYEGFYYLDSFNGNTEHASLKYILRDHNKEKFENRKSTMQLIEKLLNEKYGEGTVRVTLKDQYKNMVELIKPCMHLIDNATDAMKDLGVAPIIEPIRGGTDGATLSYMGLPCPNLGTGGHAFHGEFEHIAVESMDICTEIIIEILKRYANQ